MREELHLGSTTIIILGTIHAHQESVDQVKSTIVQVRPHYVAVELDPERLKALESGKTTTFCGLINVFKMGFRTTILNILIDYSNKKKAKKVGVPIMSDMVEAVRTAREVGSTVALIDTARTSFAIPFSEFLRLCLFLIKNSRRELKTDQESLKKFVEELNKAAPSLSKINIRDKVMAENILKLSGTIVVVTGRGNVESLKRELKSQYNRNGS
jgi:pheromone shutdown protein TraB